MKYSKIVPIHDDGKASVECLYCPELIIFKRNAGIMDPEGPACKHLVDWQVKPNKTLEVLFEATGATEKAKKERTLGDVLDEFLRYLASVQGGDMTLTCERTGLYEAAIRAAGERMQAEINALRGGIEAHKVDSAIRQAFESLRATGEHRETDLEAAEEIVRDKYADHLHVKGTLEFDHTASYVAMPVMLNGLKRGHARLPIVGHCGDPDGCAIIVRLGKVEFPLPIDFDPSK